MFEPQDFNYILNLELDSEGAGFRGMIILQLTYFQRSFKAAGGMVV